MLFNSLAFWLFLPICLFVYWWIPSKRIGFRNWYLLLVSYLFYCAWDYRFLSLIVLSTSIDFFSSIAIHGSEPSKKRYWLYLSILSNIGVLFFFKYFNFFLDSVNNLLPEESSMGSLSIILPIGISFYTFQSLSYTVDVFRGVQKPERNFITFALFVAFFPQILAGPIERANRLIPQFKIQKKFKRENLIFGFDRFLLGMVKKVVLSPAIFAYSNSLLLNPSFGTCVEAWTKGALWFLYLLMDFSGYSDMAIGIARMLGIELSENFKFVFKTQNFPDFWKRWHITLGEWFRDYVHSPLQRRGFSKYAAGFYSFLLIGLWHGASFNFLIWGMGMGVFWCLDVRFKLINRMTQYFPLAARSSLKTLFFLMFFLLLGPFFTAYSFEDAIVILKVMIGLGPEQNGSTGTLVSSSFVFSTCLALLIEFFAMNQARRGADFFSSSRAGRNLRLLVLFPVGILLCFEGLWSSAEFKYFQF